MKYISKRPVGLQRRELKNKIVETFLNGAVLRNETGMDLIPHIMPGVTLVYGSTNVGKSEFVAELCESLAERDDLLVGKFNYLEPSPAKYAHQLSTPSIVTEADLLEELELALDEGVNTFIIDSFRVAQYGLSGSAVAGGMSTGVFEMLTQLSEICYWNSIAVIIPMNPNVKEDLLDYTRSNMAGSVHNIIDLKDMTLHARDLDRVEVNISSVQGVIDAFDGAYEPRPLQLKLSKADVDSFVVDVKPFAHQLDAGDTIDQVDANNDMFDKTDVTPLKRSSNS